MSLTKMFDLLLIFLHKGFMLLFLLFFCVLSRIGFDINNALQRSDSGKNGNYYLHLLMSRFCDVQTAVYIPIANNVLYYTTLVYYTMILTSRPMKKFCTFQIQYYGKV